MPIEEEVVKKIADTHHKSAGQILVKHALQRGLCPLIKSNSRTRIIAYSEVSILLKFFAFFGESKMLCMRFAPKVRQLFACNL